MAATDTKLDPKEQERQQKVADLQKKIDGNNKRLKDLFRQQGEKRTAKLNGLLKEVEGLDKDIAKHLELIKKTNADEKEAAAREKRVSELKRKIEDLKKARESRRTEYNEIGKNKEWGLSDEAKRLRSTNKDLEKDYNFLRNQK